MTREEILSMPAGREMDALIRKFVFHRDAPRNSNGGSSLSWIDGYMCEETFYSTDISAAWEVVERCDKFLDLIKRGDVWVCGFLTEAPFTLSATANTAPLAICRAALLAVME